ncbi:conserved hypothetical protein [Flavobacterium sp. 9R]|uniref:hypothetical protein n=1 Tax=Flavobacterium sp. 9R TaxID=2653143 RepID=UPI0012F24F9A|nr:hypothetical protein [Flavobacterium sp. 9R]VXB47363.1 conserved hypothetical protein [Flavobacterium sp. 9R]
MTKYTKYRSFLLPKEIVEVLFLTAHHIPLQDNKQSEIIVGLSIINDILSKSNQKHNSEDYPYHFNPMYSKYLQLKYGNYYNTYIEWLIIHNIIWKDFYYGGKSTYFYFQSNENYLSKINFLCKENEIPVESIGEIIDTYCLRDSIKISLISHAIKEINYIQKNRIFNKWYRIKVPITKTNKKFLTKDYEQDSTYINNAPKHIKKMGSHYRKGLKIQYEEAIEHSENRYLKELSEAKNSKEEVSAFKRYSSRISSINAIHNGSLNKTLRFKRNDTNKRLDTNLTNMASDLRPFIVGYENMSYLDLSNSQPVLFNILLQSYRKNASEALLNEIDNYFIITTSGKWYEWLQGLYGLNRNECKEIWMKIAYSKNHHNPEVKQIFKKGFPLIYGIIEEIKKEKHEDFAVELQKIESKIFIDEICKELVNHGIIPYTMHDGLLVPKEHKEKTLEIMQTILKEKLGVIPLIKVE